MYMYTHINWRWTTSLRICWLRPFLLPRRYLCMYTHTHKLRLNYMCAHMLTLTFFFLAELTIIFMYMYTHTHTWTEDELHFCTYADFERLFFLAGLTTHLTRMFGAMCLCRPRMSLDIWYIWTPSRCGLYICMYVCTHIYTYVCWHLGPCVCVGRGCH